MGVDGTEDDRALRLTASELRSFASQGYVVKHAVMDPALCRQLRDQLWASNRSTVLRRDEPSSWVGPLPAHDLDADPRGGNVRSEHRWQLRERAGEALSMDALPRRCFAMAEQLLGPGSAQWPTGGVYVRRVPSPGMFEAKPGQNCRGTYVTLPCGPEVERHPLREHPGCHFDSFATTDDVTVSRVLLVGLIDDAPPDCGGFTLYPRSAHRMQDLAARLRRQGVRPSSEEAAARRRELAAAVAADTEPVDCHGGAGTVVLMHRGTAHKVAQNYSTVLRQAVLYDYVCSDHTTWHGQAIYWDEQNTLPAGDDNYDGGEGAAPPTYGPQRHLNDSYWKQQPLLSATGFPSMWEMWGAELQQLVYDHPVPTMHRL
jgi:hypothetical protein